MTSSLIAVLGRWIDLSLIVVHLFRVVSPGFHGISWIVVRHIVWSIWQDPSVLVDVNLVLDSRDRQQTTTEDLKVYYTIT